MDNVDFYLYDLKTKFNKINPKEYYLSYSGGKDSHLLYWFIKKYAPEFNQIKVVGIIIKKQLEKEKLQLKHIEIK